MDSLSHEYLDQRNRGSLRKTPLQDLVGDQGEVFLVLPAMDDWFTIRAIDLLSVMKMFTGLQKIIRSWQVWISQVRHSQSQNFRLTKSKD
jgi:hypothetical protein